MAADFRTRHQTSYFTARLGNKGKIFELDETYKDLERAGFKHLGEPLRAGRVEAITQRLVHMLEYKPYVES